MKGEELAEPPVEVLSRFPQSKEAVHRIFEEDEGFRELCSDYKECRDVLHRLHNGQGTADARFEQYCELRTHLEQELLRRISAPSPGRPEPPDPGGTRDLPSPPSP